MTRRQVVVAAISLGASPAFARVPRASRSGWCEVRERFPLGVASGDPSHDGVILWTKLKPATPTPAARIAVEVSETERFDRVVAACKVDARPDADWTCRVLVAGLRPSTDYWYRFVAPGGEGSRIGRTRTAPHPADDREVGFAFVSCQNVTMGPLNAWRRMLHDDRVAPEEQRIEFVLNLGDFVYETVWYAEDRPGGYFDRTLVNAVRFPTGERHGDYHVPVTLEDYRTLYRSYLLDPDLQDARARWPLVSMWDNGEFSDKGWQSMQRFAGVDVPAQTRKQAANQAWFEYIPARVATPAGSLEAFGAPPVMDAPIDRFDGDGLGCEPNNLAALASLTGYRAHRWGRHVELILTDQRSYRSEDFGSAPQARSISGHAFPQMVPFETLQAIDAGRTDRGGLPARTLRFADGDVANFARDKEPRTLLGAKQRAWFLDRLERSEATWKIWGNTVATFDMRADPQHLPQGMTTAWPGRGYAGFPRVDFSTAFWERGLICDFVEKRGVTGFVTLSGDRHSFWAGYSAKALPPEDFRPVGVNFVTGSLSSPGMVEALEHGLAKDHPLRPLYLVDRPGASEPQPSVNLLLRHGVATCLDYAAHGDLARAVELRDPGNAPHVEFVDMAGHGYGLVRAAADVVDVTFVCIPRPVRPPDAPDGGPVRYRVTHRAHRWRAGETPQLERVLLEGDAGLSA